MSQLNDCKLAALIAGGYGDQLNDAMLAWAQANGATSNQLNEAILEAAQASGATSNDLNDALYEVLGLLGYTGSLNDRQIDFWCIGGGVLGFRALSATMGITNDLVVVTFSDVPQNFNPIAGLQITVAGVDQLNSAVAPTLLGNTLTYTLNVTASSVDEVRWVYSQPPGLISDGVSLAPTTDLLAQAEINPVFQVPLVSSLIPLRAADFNYTFARSGANATVTDFEGLVKDVTANEARFVGARRVYNTVVSDLRTNSGNWRGFGSGSFSLDTVNRVLTVTSFLGSGNRVDSRFGVLYSGEPIAGNAYSYSFEVKANAAGDIGDSFTIQLNRYVGASSGVKAISISVPSEWTRYTVDNWTPGGDATTIGANVSIWSDEATATTVLLRNFQFEEVTGQSITTASEFVDEATSAENGTNASGVKYFDTQNGNTIVSNVVIAGTGAAIAEATLEGVSVEEVRTNYADTDDDLIGGAETIDITAGGTGGYTLSVYGTAAVTVAAGTATGSGFAQATEGNPVTFNITVVGTITLTLDSGTLDTSQAGDYLKQVEAGSFATTFIPSPTTTAATRNAESLSYPNTNMLDDEGTFAVRCTFAGSTAQYAGGGDRGVISVRGENQDMIHIANATGKVVLDDNTGTTSTTALPAIVAGDLTRLASRWNATDLSMTMGQEFVESEVAFDGSMNKSTPIYIGGGQFSNKANGSYKEVRGWPLAVDFLPYITQLPSP